MERKVIRTFYSPFNNGNLETLQKHLDEGWVVVLATPFHRSDCIEYILEKIK